MSLWETYRPETHKHTEKKQCEEDRNWSDIIISHKTFKTYVWSPKTRRVRIWIIPQSLLQGAPPPRMIYHPFFSFLLCCGYLSRVVFHVLSANISMGNTCNNSPGLVYDDASKSLGSNFLSKFSCKAITVISFLCLYNRLSSWWWCEVKGVGLEFLSREGNRNSLIQMYFHYPRTFIPIKLLCP